MTFETKVLSPVVSAQDVDRQYGHAGSPLGGVRGISLRVDAGEILGVRGPSGAGKSTLLRLLSGIERPDRGSLEYDGVPSWPETRFARHPRRPRYPRPGYVMPIYQDPFASLDPRWPIWRTVTEPLLVSSGDCPRSKNRRAVLAEHRATVQNLLSRSGMEHVDVDARPGELSGGQCQRIAILRAIITRPSLIVADEPTARQDIITAASMTEQLTETAMSGTAIVVVSHNTAWLEGFADRVVELVDGRLVDEGGA